MFMVIISRSRVKRKHLSFIRYGFDLFRDISLFHKTNYKLWKKGTIIVCFLFTAVLVIYIDYL
jgi:hypothetical protein